MALPVYNTGLAKVALGSSLVEFSGGASLTVVDATTGSNVNITGAGDLFFFGLGMGVVKRVITATLLELFLPWQIPVDSPGQFTIVRQSVPLVGSAAALAQSIQNMGDDDNPLASLAVDNGVSRIKERISAAGKPQLAVGATDAADSALVAAIEIDPVTGVVSFPSGSSSTGGGGGAVNNCSLQNRLLNGAFEIWQSGTTFTVANGTTALTADRWIADNHSGASATFAKAIAPGGFRTRSAVKIDITGATSSGYFGETQAIGSHAANDLDGQSITLSFDIYATTTAGTLTGKISLLGNAATDDGSFSVSLFDGTFTVPVGPGKVSVTIPAASTVGIKNGARLFVGIQQNASTGTVSAYLSSVQLEKGIVADDFDYRPNSLEYWLLSTPPGGAPKITFDPVSQQPLFNPASSVTPPSNGLVTLSKPSDTRLRWQIKGSDGIVRKIDVSNQVNRNEQTGSYTLVGDDANGAMVVFNSSSPGNLTVPAGVAPVGSVIPVYIKGTGQLTVVAGSGVTINTASSMTSRARFSMLSLYQDATDEWVLSGDLT